MVGTGRGDIGKVRKVGKAGGDVFRYVRPESGQDVFIPHAIAAVTGGGGAKL